MLEAGQVIGGWELIRRLGARLFSDVWLARDAARGVERALDVPTDPECIRQLRHHDPTRLAPHHPNIVQTFDLNTRHDPPYCVTEHVEGDTLRQRLASQGRLPTDEALGIVRQVLAALRAAHAAGILHRGLRPANILLTPQGVVKLAGFAFGRAQAELAASLIRSGAATSASATSLALAADYRSPEQRRGLDAAPCDDIYSVGVLACELLTGRRPTDAPVGQLLEQAGLCGPIADVVVTACDDRDYRYPTAVEMLRSVARLPPSVPELITSSGGMRLRLIQPGPFVMGSDTGRDWERPAHDVTITRPFYLGVCPVTQAQYERVTAAAPSTFHGPDRPVETVSWDDARGFCRRLSQAEGAAYRLPTEAEWEYACRAGSTAAYSFGDSEWLLAQYAWYAASSRHAAPGQPPAHQTHPVGDLKPNAWGLHDVHGNVWEWCRDYYVAYRPGAQADPQGPSEGRSRVVRGGSWRNTPAYCRSATRNHHAPGFSCDHLGFRVVRAVP